MYLIITDEIIIKKSQAIFLYDIQSYEQAGVSVEYTSQ